MPKYYKAFNHDFTCRDKQYEENTVYEENGSEICKAGMMHFCENPFDTLEYYPLVDDNGNISEWAEVEPMSDLKIEGNKSATSKLKVGAKLGLKGFIQACIDFTLERTKQEKSSGDRAQIGSSGDRAQIGSSGNRAQIGSSGDYAQIGSSGNYAQIGSSGYYAQIGSSGDYAQIGSSGDRAQIGSSGYCAQIGSSGDGARIGSSGGGARIGSSGNYAQIGSSGNYARIKSDGLHSVIMCAGHNSIAKAKIGSFITLTEWGEDENNNNIPLNVVTKKVDGKRIKEDTFYTLKDGKFIEVEDK